MRGGHKRKGNSFTSIGTCCLRIRHHIQENRKQKREEETMTTSNNNNVSSPTSKHTLIGMYFDAVNGEVFIN